MYGFGSIDDVNATYYALDNLNSTHSNFVLYNRNWKYLTYKTMPIYAPSSIQSLNNELFITGNGGIYKTDKSLILVKSYTTSGPLYRGIYHNNTTDVIYVANWYFNKIDLLYRNLSFIRSLNLINNPWALTEKNGKLYVGFTDGSISVIENNLVVKNITTLCPGWITSILIDANELMAVLCLNQNKLYLYSTNGSYTGKSMTTSSSPQYINFDLNGHFIIVGGNQINLYY